MGCLVSLFKLKSGLFLYNEFQITCGRIAKINIYLRVKKWFCVVRKDQEHTLIPKKLMIQSYEPLILANKRVFGFMRLKLEFRGSPSQK
jgi:hypothetical protein